MHSGMSAVLLFATFAGSGVLPLELALVFVIGANVGVALIPMVAVLRDVPQAVQIPLGNIIMRMTVGVIALFSLPYMMSYMLESGWSIQQNVIFAHIGYNILLALLFLPFIGPLAKLCGRLSPALRGQEVNPYEPKYLDRKALTSPAAALSCAMRETLHLSEIFEEMFQKSYTAIANNDNDMINDVIKKDEALDTIFASIKDYIIRLTREELDDKEAAKAMAIMNFATNIEHCGDIIEGSLMDMAIRKANARDQFSEEGLAEIGTIHHKVSKNIKLAQNIFLSSDPELARQLLDYKRGLKLAENESAMNHLKRLKAGLPATMATTGMHTDVIRDFRRINTYITSVAYDAVKD
jgi:phosphate:Na+ symporter